MDSDWFEKRRTARKMSQEDVGKVVHKHRSVISRIESGDVSIQIEDVQNFANAYGTCAIEILYRAGLWDERPGIYLAPLINTVEAGDFVDTVPDEPDLGAQTMVVEHDRPTVFALTVVGDSMDRIAPEGSTIIIDYADKELEDGDLFVFRRHGEATFRRYRKDDAGVYLEPDSTNRLQEAIVPENGEDIEVIGRVINIRRGRQ